MGILRNRWGFNKDDDPKDSSDSLCDSSSPDNTNNVEDSTNQNKNKKHQSDKEQADLNPNSNQSDSFETGVESAAASPSTPESPLSDSSNFTEVTESAEPSSPSKSPVNNMFEMVKINVHRRLMDEMDMTRLMSLGPEQTERQVRSALEHLLNEEEALFSASDKQRLIDEMFNEIMGLGPLETLLQDPTVNDILINGPDHVFVERAGQLTESPVTFKDQKHLLQIIDRIVAAVGRRVDESTPLCDARLKDGSRFNCVIPPLALDGPLVSIRKFSKDPLTVDKLIQFGTLTPDSAQLLRGYVESRLNVVISGSTGSGKTTMLNVLSSFIPDDERIVTIEDAAELQLQKSHVARMETRPPNIEGRGEITMRDLFKNALRMRPERIVVGECRGGECLDMLQAMNTGHDGSLTTLHANSPRDALRRMETMVMMSGYELPSKAIREQMASAVNVVVQVSRLSDGSRRVMNISEVVGMEGDVILLQDVFKFDQHGLDEHQKVVGEFRPTGIRPRFFDHMLSHGVDVDESVFKIRRGSLE